MKVFCFESIKIHSPDSLDEMKKIMLEILSPLGKPDEKKPVAVSFINPEIFLRQNECSGRNELHQFFLNTRYNFLDGIGIIHAINSMLGTCYNIKNRYPGTDFFDYLPSADALNGQKIRIFLYGGILERNLKAAEKLLQKYDNVIFSGSQDGYSEATDEQIVDKINASESDILIVCTGCPKQELWIQRNICKLKVRMVFGNGGSIDFWSGSVNRAPRLMIKLGFEWLFRLSQDFSLRRIKRVLKLYKFFINYKLKKYSIYQMQEE